MPTVPLRLQSTPIPVNLSSPRRNAFTLIELLIVIAIIAILSVVVIFVLNPVTLLQQGRDSSRISDMTVLDNNINFASEVGSEGGISLGSPNTLYISIPDPVATSTAGDQCQGLGLSALPSGWSYHCAASSTYRAVNGTGWVPINFTVLPGGSPSAALPVDPVNQTSTFLYYSYAMNSSYQYQLYAHFESASQQAQEGAEGTPGIDPTTYKVGSNVNIAPFAGGMVGYWPFSEGTGAITADLSGYGNTGTLEGGTTWTTAPNGGGLMFDGSTGYVQLSNNLSSTIMSPTGFTMCAWVNPNTGSPSQDNYYEILGDYNFELNLWSYPSSPSYFGITAIAQNPGNASTQQVFYSNSWHEVCVVQSGTGSATLYVDGSQVGPANQNAGTPTSPTFPLASIGAMNYTSGKTYFFNGSIGAIRVYQRMLSAKEIAAMYSQGD